MIALYPGAFKPPHRGHFEIVQRLLDGTIKGKLYGLDNYKQAGSNVLDKNFDKVEKVDKVVIFIGGNDRNGINKEQSAAIWEIYKKYIPNIEVITKEGNPMTLARDYAAENKDEQFYAVTGIREKDDLRDLGRISAFKKTPNVKGLSVTSNDSNKIRATNFRKAMLSGNLD